MLMCVGMLFASLSGCFNTREVEPPTTPNADWVSPTDYSILMGNLTRSIQQLNAQNYLRCFKEDSFRFVPTTPVYTGNELIWDNWVRQDEQTWYDRVVAGIGIPTGNNLVLEEVDFQTFSSDSVRLTGEYSLSLNHTDTALTVNFKGQLVFLMRINAFNEWEIWRWEDYETHPDSSWSKLKLKYVQ
jgi:hypothetical protein